MESLNALVLALNIDPFWLQVIQAMQLPVVALLTFFTANSVTRAIAVQADVAPALSGIVNKKNPVAFFSVGFAFNAVYLFLNLLKAHYYQKSDIVPHDLTLCIYVCNIATGCCFYLQSLPSFLLDDESDRWRKWMIYAITIVLTVFIAGVFDENGFIIAIFNFLAYFLASAYVYRLSSRYRSARSGLARTVILSGWTLWTLLQTLRPTLGWITVPEDTIELIGFTFSLLAKCFILFGIYYFSIRIARHAYFELNDKVQRTTSLQRAISIVNNSKNIDELTSKAVRDLVADDQFGFDYAIFWEVDHLRGRVVNRERAISNASVQSPEKWGPDGGLLLGSPAFVARSARNREVLRIMGDKLGRETIDLDAADSPLDKDEFERFEQKNLSRAYLPIRRVESRTSEIYPSNVVAVMEVGYCSSAGGGLKPALPSVHAELDIYLNSVAEIYGRLFDQALEQKVDSALRTCDEDAKDDPNAYLALVLAAACELMRSDLCIFVSLADRYVPQLYSSDLETPDRQAFERLRLEMDRAALHNEMADETIVEIVRNLYPAYTVQAEATKSPNRSAAGLLLTLSRSETHSNNVVRSILERIANGIPAPYSEKRFHNAVTALVTKDNIATELDELMEPILAALRGYFASSYIWIWLRTTSGDYRPVSAAEKSALPPFSASLEEVRSDHEYGSESSVRIFRTDSSLRMAPGTALEFVKRHNIKTLLRKEFKAPHQTLGFVDIAFANEIADIPYEDANFLALIEIKATAAIQLHNIIRSFREISDTFARNDLDSTLLAITRSAMSVLGADPVLLYKSSNGKDVYFRDVTYANKDSFRDEGILKVFSSEPDAHAELAEMILADKTRFFSNELEFRAYLRRHTKIHEKVFFKRDFWDREGIASLAAIRLEFRSANYVRPIGVLFINFRHPVEFTSELSKVIGTFADLAAASIHQAMVSDQSRRFVLSNLRLNRPIILEALGAGALHNAKKAFDTIRSLFLNILNKIDNQADSDDKRISATAIRTQLEGLREPFALLHGRFLEIKQRYSPDEPLVLGRHGIKGILQQQMEATETEFFDLRVKVEYDLPINEIRIDCDKGQIGLALLNIIKNAYQAMSVRGELSVHLKDVDDQVRIDITDNGRGISEEMREVMFQPNITDKPGGTGLGLSMSKYVIENNHKGKINGRTRQGKTTFTIFLPKEQDGAAVGRRDGGKQGDKI